MNKNIYTILSLAFLSLFQLSQTKLHAAEPYFEIPSEVCFGHEVIPENVIEASSYEWSFCSPNLATPPSGFKQNLQNAYNEIKAIHTGKHNDYIITFSLTLEGKIIRTIHKNENSFFAEPISVLQLFNIPISHGIQLIEEDGIYHLFSISNQGVGVQLTRLDFPEGLDEDPIIGDNQILNVTSAAINRLTINQEESGLYVGFVFTEGNELLRLTFDNGLYNSPNIMNLGNPNNVLSNPVDMYPVFEDDTWHLFVINHESQTLARISFLHSMTNPPIATNLGSFDGRIRRPSGISYLKDCNSKYLLILNKGSETIVQLSWTNQPITDTPHPQNIGNMADFISPTSMSNAFVDDENRTFFLVGNVDNKMSFVYYDECGNVVFDRDDIEQPTFKYTEPGVYTVTLFLPDGTSYCKNITITPRPEITYTEDVLICQGDTTTLSAVSHGSRTTTWTPNYNLSSNIQQIIEAYPEYTTMYTSETYFAANCIVKHNILVEVSHNKADAGEDRMIKDGSKTILGGPNTSVGPQFTYQWTPELGMLESSEQPYTSVEPPFNTTYYLNVYNTDGCHAIDSVLVIVPCDDIHLPNAFMPEGNTPENQTFGLMNKQIAKINYFAIYDRWGNEVFATTDPNEEWDGTFNGQKASPGVYVWQVDGYCANTEERYRRSGNVTLIR